MADPHHHHHDPIQDNIDAHPVKLAIWIVIGAIALIVGIYLLVQLAVHGYANRDMKGQAAVSDAAVKQRIAPVAKVALDPNAAAPAAMMNSRRSGMTLLAAWAPARRAGVNRCAARSWPDRPAHRSAGSGRPAGTRTAPSGTRSNN